MPRSRPPRLSWPPVIVCGLAVAYAAVVVALSAVNAPIPPAQVNSIVAGAFAAAAVIAIRPAVSCRCESALDEMRQELRGFHEVLAAVVEQVQARARTDGFAEGYVSGIARRDEGQD